MNKAAIYCRISRDPEGLRAGVTRQEEDSRALAAREGLEVVRLFVDNDAGASSLSRKPRPQYAVMLEAARAGEFDTILAYSNSRLTRRLRELEDLLDLYDHNGTTIRTVVSGSDDLSTADGRMVARIKASVDAAEAERTGERLRRAHLQKAQAGTVHHGARAFGWNDDKVTLHPVESALIRQAVADLLDGVALNDVARTWNGAGVTTARGNRWDHRAVRQVLRQPRMAGWRVHQGKVARDASGAPVRGAWEPMLEDETYERLLAVLTPPRGAPSTRRGRRGRRLYLLSGLVRCGVCGGRMFGVRKPTGHTYGCAGMRDGVRTTINGPMTDEAVTAVVLARLAQERGDLRTVERRAFPKADRLAAIPEKIAEVMGAYNAGAMSAAVAFPQVTALEAEQSELEAERREWEAVAGGPPGPREVDPERFADLDTARQRAVMEQLLEAVVVAPAKSRGARWTPDRLTYVWRTS